MTSRDFCYWLQGFFEIGKPAALTPEATDLVKRHLALVFKHEIDPSAGGQEVQKVLQDIHDAAAHQSPNPPRIGGHGPDGTTVYRC